MTMHVQKIIRPSELARRLSVDRSTVWRWVKNHVLPPPLRLSRGVSGWKESDIERWLSAHAPDVKNGGDRK